MMAENKSTFDLNKLLEMLDEQSCILLWHLWLNRHANISELKEVTGASDWDVLSRLKEVINVRAMEVFGKPALAFKESETDLRTGEKVLFSWWLLNDESSTMTSGEKAFVDVFQEKNGCTIFAQLPSLISAEHSNGRKDMPEIKVREVKFHNGILQISLQKEGDNLGNDC